MIHLLTGWSNQYEVLAHQTYPGKLAYAKQWNYSCRHFVHQYTPLEARLMMWERPSQWLRSLQEMPEGDWLWFSGCDVLITNPSVDIAKFCDNRYELICATDCHVPQLDSFLLKKCLNSIQFLKSIIEAKKDDRIKDEQEAAAVILGEFDTYTEFYTHVGFMFGTVEQHCRMFDAMNHSPLLVKLVTSKYFNSLHRVHIRNNLPPGDGGHWNPGDLVLHMCCQSLDYRLNNIGDFIPREHKHLQFKAVNFNP